MRFGNSGCRQSVHTHCRHAAGRERTASHDSPHLLASSLVLEARNRSSKWSHRAAGHCHAHGALCVASTPHPRISMHRKTLSGRGRGCSESSVLALTGETTNHLKYRQIILRNPNLHFAQPITIYTLADKIYYS